MLIRSLQAGACDMQTAGAPIFILVGPSRAQQGTTLMQALQRPASHVVTGAIRGF